MPNKLIISPHHIAPKQFGSRTFSEVFNIAPELFDVDHPIEPNYDIPSKLENAYAEYFQITFFLIFEKLKRDKSFWKPYFDSLPQKNETLFTLTNDAKIK